MSSNCVPKINEGSMEARSMRC